MSKTDFLIKKLSCSIFDSENSNFKRKQIITNQLEIIFAHRQYFSHLSKNYKKAFDFLNINNIPKALRLIHYKNLISKLFMVTSNTKLHEITSELILYADIQVLLDNIDFAKKIYGKIIIVDDSKETKFKYALFYDLILGDSEKAYNIYQKLQAEVFKHQQINSFINYKLGNFWFNKKLLKISKLNLYNCLKNNKNNILTHTYKTHFLISKLHYSLMLSKTDDFEKNLKYAIAFCAKAIKNVEQTNAQIKDIHEQNINDFSRAKMLLHLSKLLLIFLELNFPLSEDYTKKKEELKQKYTVLIPESKYYDEFFMELSYNNITNFHNVAIKILEQLSKTYNYSEINSEFKNSIAQASKYIHNYSLPPQYLQSLQKHIPKSNEIVNSSKISNILIK